MNTSSDTNCCPKEATQEGGELGFLKIMRIKKIKSILNTQQCQIIMKASADNLSKTLTVENTRNYRGSTTTSGLRPHFKILLKFSSTMQITYYRVKARYSAELTFP